MPQALTEPFLVDLTDFQRPLDLLSWFMTNVIDSAQEIQRSDDQLMEAAMNRESEALECIYMRYESLLRTVILGVIRDESEVDDILHDVLLQVWDLGDKYKPGPPRTPGHSGAPACTGSFESKGSLASRN